MKHLSAILLILVFFGFTGTANAQAEFQPWGNITGIRVNGQLFEFETSLAVVYANGQIAATAKERQRPHYKRDGNIRIIDTRIDSLFFKETVADKSRSTAELAIRLNSHSDTYFKAIYFCINLPETDYGRSRILLKNAYSDSLDPNSDANIKTSDISCISPDGRKLQISFNKPMPLFISKDTVSGFIQLHIQLAQGMLHKNDSLQTQISLTVSGDIDRTPVKIAVDTTQHGRPFAGLGGNFRLQNPKFDPEVIDYCLNNLRVAWGRVEMPWRFWQPDEQMDTSDSVKLHPAVVKAMLMAQRLSKQGIPVILTAWFPPNWAVLGKVNFRPVNGIWGNPLNPDKMQEVYKSITGYIKYLKWHYGVDVALFSFNESDLGINVRITPEEHDALIKGLGAYFLTHGIETKMLLGDNSDANTYRFIYPVLADTAAWRYIGAVSFHSWRGWDTPTLQIWANAAKRLNKPLIVGEGSIDAQASGYPQVFEEPAYALEEINLYTRLLHICQPLSILQWQLTSDYSPLIGGGIFGNDEPLHPGQRFWNLKQLSATPADLFAMPVSSGSPVISCAALGDNSSGKYTIHLVNNGAGRQITITGLPAQLKTAVLLVTNETKSMQKVTNVKFTNGAITFKAEATSYYTLTCGTK